MEEVSIMSPKTTRFLAAVLLSSTLASPVLAEQVRLKSADGNIDMMVELLSYDDANYEIRLGGATASSLVPRSALACEGAACPPGVAATAEAPAAEEEKEAEPVYAERRPDPDLVIIGSDSVGEDLLPLMLSPYAEMLGGGCFRTGAGVQVAGAIFVPR